MALDSLKMRSPSRWFCLLLLALPPAGALRAQEGCRAGPTALVLAGGGAKGFVHLGVIRTLDSLGIRPDFIVGTSMGAVIGALYASGYSPHDIDSLTRSVPLTELLRPRSQPPSRAYTLFRPLISWELEEGKIRLAPAAVPEQGIDAALNSVLLRGNLQARGDFGRLPIPFFAVATDLATHRPVALHDGDLAQAVRASMALPLVFEPVKIGDRTLADGGLAANVPVRLARELGATRVIISDLVRKPSTVVDFSNPLTVATALLDYLFSQTGDSALAGDLLIETDVTGIANLDFAPRTLDTLFARGELAARAALDRHDGCLPRARSSLPASDTTPQRVTSLAVPGFKRRELEELLGTLGLAQGITLQLPVLRRGFVSLARDGRFRSVWLDPAPTDSGLSLDLHVRRAPQGSLGLGIAYDNELGARMFAAGQLEDPVTRTFQLTGIASVGGLRRDLLAAARRRFHLAGHPSLLASVLGRQEEIPYFTPKGEPLLRPRLPLATGTLGFEWSFGDEWLLRMGGEARAWSDTAHAGHEALAGIVTAQQATTDGEILVLAEGELARGFQRAALSWQLPLTAGRWTFTPGIRAGAIRGSEQPVTDLFPLGGTDGFPGLRLMERRGATEAMVSTSFAYQLDGPFQLRLQGAAGDTRSDSAAAVRALVRGDGWLVGWRVGLGVRSSPLGPIRLEYGATSVAGDYRDQLFLRVGRWF